MDVILSGNPLKTAFITKRHSIAKSLYVVVFCVFSIGIFAPLCLFSHHVNPAENNLECLFSIHSFTYRENELSALFTLPFMGLFFLILNISIPPGFLMPPYRPPRFVH